MTLFFTIMAAFLQSQSEHFQEYYSLFKPSAFESEILPLHKLRLCNGDFALAGGRGQQSLPYNASAFGIPPLFPICIHLQEGGQGTIQRHSFIRMGKLPDVRGRITYISSHAKQENLYAVYETTNRHYWTELAKCNQQEFQKSGAEGKCIEAREFIIALPESFPSLYEPDKLLQLFTDRFKEKIWFGVCFGTAP